MKIRKHCSKVLKAIVCAALLALCFSVAAGAALQPQEETLLPEEDARQVFEDLRAGNFQAVVDKFDETMAAAIDAAGLKNGWDSAVMMLGEYQEHVSAEGTHSGALYSVKVLERYEHNGLLLNVVYDAQGKIAGLQITYADVGNAASEETGKETEAAENEFYTEEEVTVAAEEEFSLGATLTLPKGVQKPPVVIFVHGSGSSDRDEELYGNRPFADIAHGLAERGIASLRYDKRHFVYPENAAELGTALTLREETLDDLSAAIALMEAEERVNGTQIFVLGHSMGGMLTPAIAAEHPELAGVISVAGSLRPLWEIVYDQNQEVIARTLAETPKEQWTDELRQTFDAQTETVEKDIEVLRNDLDAQADDTVLFGISASYWKSQKEYCGANFISEVDMPMLILQGEADFQVYADRDYVLWKETLKDKENAEFHLYEGLNHLMMPTQGKRDVSDYAVKSHVDDQVISDIAAFIDRYTAG